MLSSKKFIRKVKQRRNNMMPSSKEYNCGVASWDQVRKRGSKGTLTTNNQLINQVPSSTNFIWKVMNWEQAKQEFRDILATDNKLIYLISSFTNSIWSVRSWNKVRKKFPGILTKVMKLRDIPQIPAIYLQQQAKTLTQN